MGTDHGFLAKAVLDGNKAQCVVVSDISADSLAKATRLLRLYGERVKSVVSDGLALVDPDVEQAVIAGMGGEEIIHIVQTAPFLPDRLVVQPMKNADKVRKRLLMAGYRLTADYKIEDGKFYDVIAAVKGEDEYTEDELFFGRDNLRRPGADFLKFARIEYNKYLALSTRQMPAHAADKINKIKEKYGGLLNENKRNLR